MSSQNWEKTIVRRTALKTELIFLTGSFQLPAAGLIYSTRRRPRATTAARTDQMR